MKNPLTPAGIEPAIFGFVAQRTLGIAQQKPNTWTTVDSVVLPLAACTHFQSTALPLSTSELTVVNRTAEEAYRARCRYPILSDIVH